MGLFRENDLIETNFLFLTNSCTQDFSCAVDVAIVVVGFLLTTSAHVSCCSLVTTVLSFPMLVSAAPVAEVP